MTLPSAGEIKLTRKPNWDTDAFDKFLMSRATEPFVWGKNDCALFVADGIEAITGVDIAADFRGYTSEKTALKTIAQVCGGSSLEDAVVWCAKKFGLVEWEFPLMARRGDLVVFPESGRIISGLVHLNGRHLVSPGDSGFKRLPITDVKRAWHYE